MKKNQTMVKVRSSQIANLSIPALKTYKLSLKTSIPCSLLF